MAQEDPPYLSDPEKWTLLNLCVLLQYSRHANVLTIGPGEPGSPEGPSLPTEPWIKS